MLIMAVVLAAIDKNKFIMNVIGAIVSCTIIIVIVLLKHTIIMMLNNFALDNISQCSLPHRTWISPKLLWKFDIHIME